MKNNITELAFILDRSGSMSGLESDTIGGFNALIARQRKEAGFAYVTTVLFNDKAVCVHDRLNIQDVPIMTERDYIPGGCTALLDAIGDTIQHIVGIHRYARAEDVPAKTVIVITTDGMENASHRYTLEKVREMIRHEQEKYGWEFLFLGADIDAVEAASGIGIQASRTTNFMHDDRGIELSFEAVSDAISSVKCGAPIPTSWKSKVEADHRARRRK